jgi:TolB-like protein
MLAGDGRIVLMDFGSGLPSGTGRMADPDVAGTPLYLAPEVLKGNKATIRSDIYSLGVVLYRMLTGSYPLAASSLAALGIAHDQRSADKSRTVRTGRPDVPGSLAAILDRAMDPRPEHRYESAAALADALSAIGPARQRSARFSIAATAAIVVATLIGAGFWFSHGQWRSVAPGQPLRIAVMPFEMQDGQEDADLLRVAMAEDIRSRLARYDDARVISKASAFSLAPITLPVSEIRTLLRADAVLMGRLRRRGDTLEVDARVVSVAGEREVWAKHYVRPVAKRLALHHEIAAAVADVLNLDQPRAAMRWPTRNPQAHALYVRGRSVMGGSSAAG